MRKPRMDAAGRCHCDSVAAYPSGYSKIPNLGPISFLCNYAIVPFVDLDPTFVGSSKLPPYLICRNDRYQIRYLRAAQCWSIGSFFARSETDERDALWIKNALF